MYMVTNDENADSDSRGTGKGSREAEDSKFQRNSVTMGQEEERTNLSLSLAQSCKEIFPDKCIKMSCKCCLPCLVCNGVSCNAPNCSKRSCRTGHLPSHPQKHWNAPFLRDFILTDNRATELLDYSENDLDWSCTMQVEHSWQKFVQSSFGIRRVPFGRRGKNTNLPTYIPNPIRPSFLRVQISQK